MNTLGKFIRYNVSLVDFEQELTDPVIAESSVFALEVHREELRSIWTSIKVLYEQCVEETEKKGRSSEDQSQEEGGENHLESISARYHSSYETYVRVMEKIGSHIQERSRPTNPTQPIQPPPPPPTSTIHSNFHVPPCDTASFRGDYQSWPSFRDMFSAIYIKNASLSNVQKLFHLRKKTEGEAHDIVKKCPLTNSGFDIAWANLTKRFENKRMLVQGQLKLLFNLSTITSESSEEIKCLLRDINASISSLKLYDIDISSWDAIFVYICSTKLPRTTLSLWEHSVNNKKEISKWVDLDAFLSSRYQTLETVSEVKGQSSSNKTQSNSHSTQHFSKGPQRLNSNHANISDSSEHTKCKLCVNENHPIRKCPRFLQMNVEERSSYIRKLNLCFNCFARAHTVKECKSRFNCSSCNKRHNSLLHRGSENAAKIASSSSGMISNRPHSYPSQIQSTSTPRAFNSSVELSTDPSTSGANVQSCFAAHSQNVLLGTAVVQVNHLGLKYSIRSLIDSGSQGTFISERVFNLLKLPFQTIDAKISGLNGVTSAKSKKLATFCVCPRNDSNLELTLNALVVPKLSGNLPATTINYSILNTFPNVVLADPKFYESSSIDLLIGADVFNKILLDRVKRNICGSLVAQETIFGWIITGAIEAHSEISSFSNMVSFFTETSLEKQLKRFWEVENIPQKQVISYSDAYCEKLYAETTKRDSDGRYIVSLPFKEKFYDKSLQLGQSRTIAHAQFLRNESRLCKNIDQKLKYDSVIQEYLELGHMEEVSTPLPENFPGHYYLPHHAIVKPDSTTTKTRVVFNASSPTSTGISLNDLLYTGPTLQNDITILLLRWRFYRFVFNADIEKMYRQIKVSVADTAFQRILHRASPTAKVKDFELKRVTFGINAAPYLAIRTLHEVAKDVATTYPLASEIIKNAMYVDDVIAGFHSVESAIIARDQLVTALSLACFPLRKWTSNSALLLKGIPKEHLLQEDFLSFDDSSQTKTLGVKWNAKTDHFLFTNTIVDNRSTYTKKEVLSGIAKIYDPAGWLAPIVVRAKILMRRIWISKVDWDSPITYDCLQDWKTFLSSYANIGNIKLPRWVSYSPTCRLQFHAFCDVSEDAFAAVIYARVELEGSSVAVSLLTSKSRVSPVNSLSIPKLELCGATLLADLVDSIIPQMHVSSCDVFKWTDSTIVLAWLQKPACQWKVFVANRVSRIVEKVGADNWFHIDSKSNPADLASRGVFTQDLIHNNLWWHGPPWLERSSDCWPIKSELHLDTDLERKTISCHLSVHSDYQDVLERFSSFSRAIQVICYIFRFFHRTHPTYRSTVTYSSVLLTSSEVLHVKNRLIMLAQRSSFSDTLKALQKKENIPKSSPILNLNPFLDGVGVIRACGRLAYSPSLCYNERYPIILPYSCQLSKLLIRFTHLICLHGGNQQVVRLIRTEFWIPKLKNLVKTTIHNCKECVLHKKKVQTQLMAALPQERTVLHRPFHSTGVDFAGPFEIKTFAGRGCKTTKGYVCVFVCFATKAIHLEATSSLSTETFLAAFYRFVSRRGCPLHLYSDNGTNFIGASKDIAKDFLTASRAGLVNKFVHQNLSWHFIPPGAPHMGGLWEAGVKSFKTHFKKVAGSFKYTYEEFCTLLSKIEACINSRPISVMSDDPTDLNPLTPGHFLIGGPILAPPEPTLESHPESVINRWQRVKVLQQHFCQRWKIEYLKELHKRNKWNYPKKDIEIDSIVAIRDENLPPNEWRIGRVTRLYAGQDNRIRVADVYTTKGTIKRPIVKLVVLPTQQPHPLNPVLKSN